MAYHRHIPGTAQEPPRSADVAEVDGARGRHAFLRVPRGAQALIVLAVCAALVLPVWLRSLGVPHPRYPAWAALPAVVLVSVVNVELGRLIEGGVSSTHRPHKALSAWAFCTALLVPTPYLLPVVALSYAHARWRGLRVQPWKWVGSGAFVVLSGLTSAAAARLVMGDDVNLMGGDGRRGLLAVLVGVVVFLLTEALLLHGIAYLNAPGDETWLRRTLAGRSFYATEAGVLLMGGLTAAVWDAGSWFLLLLVPVYALAQRSVLNEPLVERANTDDKTGLLRYERWRDLAVAEQHRCEDRGVPWSVLFADLDHFKSYNDAHGHLAGDAALVEVATVLRAQLRTRDLVARFGGEEFCVFLPGASLAHASQVAERLRSGIETRLLPGSGTRTTISVGAVAVTVADARPELVQVLTAADRALFRAKTEGRNRTVVTTFLPGPTLQQDPAPDGLRHDV